MNDVEVRTIIENTVGYEVRDQKRNQEILEAKLDAICNHLQIDIKPLPEFGVVIRKEGT